jgi:hypothetical protein
MIAMLTMTAKVHDDRMLREHRGLRDLRDWPWAGSANYSEGAAYPHTSLAVSTISDNFAISSSIVRAFPSTVDENPHWGLRHS